MYVDIRNDRAVFLCTGRVVYAHCGIIGLCEDMEVSEGYDGDFSDGEQLVGAEREELADYMIALWTRYREAV